MRKNLQKIISLFFLALFLFPLVERELHAFEHADDFHCTSSDKHFHELEHTCSICDYTIIDKQSSGSPSFEYALIIQPFLYSSFVENVNVPSAFSDLPSRAPPIS